MLPGRPTSLPLRRRPPLPRLLPATLRRNHMLWPLNDPYPLAPLSALVRAVAGSSSALGFRVAARTHPHLTALILQQARVDYSLSPLTQVHTLLL